MNITRLFEKLLLKILKADDNEIVGGSGSKCNKIVMNLTKNLTCVPNIRAIKKLILLTYNAKKIFYYLRQVFIKAPIFQHFDLKSYIWIETDALSYAMNKILSQLN